MFPRSIIAGLLSALFAGAALGVQAQTLPAADHYVMPKATITFRTIYTMDFLLN